MCTPSSSLVSSSSRPVQLRMRPDLQVTRQSYQGREYWVIKDPLGLRYYRFEDEEHALLSLLDGRSSLDQVRDRFEARFAPQKISAAELHQLIGLLYRNGLLLSDLPGQGDQLAERANQQRRQLLLGKLSSVLAMRFRGFDPDRFLNRLNRWAGWLFTLPALAAALLLMLSALLLIAAEFEVFRARLPEFRE